MDIILTPFSWLLKIFYEFSGSYGLALILFGVAIKLILLPISAKSKKSMMKMSRMAPRVKALEAKYGDDKARYQTEVMKLYKKEGVSTTGGCLWSLIPLLILWCGIGETTKTAIIFLASFFPMYLNIVKGFTGCDRKLLEVGEMFGYSRGESFFRIILPYASADILVGMRIGLGYSWRAIIAAEMVAASTGLGHMILFAQQMSRTDKVIVGILVIGLVGLATDRIFAFLIGKLLKGNYENGWD